MNIPRPGGRVEEADEGRSKTATSVSASCAAGLSAPLAKPSLNLTAGNGGRKEEGAASREHHRALPEARRLKWSDVDRLTVPAVQPTVQPNLLLFSELIELLPEVLLHSGQEPTILPA